MEHLPLLERAIDELAELDRFLSLPWPQQPGVMYPTPMSPDNLSETYSWWASTKEAVPATERSQFLGDPRHLNRVARAQQVVGSWKCVVLTL